MFLPVIIFGFLGFIIGYSHNKKKSVLIVSIILALIVLGSFAYWYVHPRIKYSGDRCIGRSYFTDANYNDGNEGGILKCRGFILRSGFNSVDRPMTVDRF
jgi:hypothetical protein